MTINDNHKQTVTNKNYLFLLTGGGDGDEEGFRPVGDLRPGGGEVDPESNSECFLMMMMSACNDDDDDGDEDGDDNSE